MNPELFNLAQEGGWSVECEAPLERRHTDGSLATQQAAQTVLAQRARETVERAQCRRLYDCKLVLTGEKGQPITRFFYLDAAASLVWI